ncbi:MAG: sodium:proton antiporter NhaD [Chitinophagales bacterium]
MIALEHPLKIDKATSAILTGVICWTVLFLGQTTIFSFHVESHYMEEVLSTHLGEIAQILFFLMGAMAIVELIDSHDGFEVVTSRITTTNKVKLLWIISIVTFFFSAVLDNLTTAIVMAALLKKLMAKKEDLWYFGGIVIIAANAGGAWSPIGDVTTIMLWNGGQVSAGNIVTNVFLPSIICLLLPLLIITFTKKGVIERPLVVENEDSGAYDVTKFEQLLIFTLGVLGLLFVPIFKNLTHLPPFMGMLSSLGVMWVVTDIIHRKKPTEHKHQLSVVGVIRKVDTPSVLFFLGVLLAVASLQTAGHLDQLAILMDETFGNIYVINVLIGLLSSIVDNVPLVAGAIGMYPLTTYAQDHTFWELLAYCAGTGGSVLIIGSAAGVAIMGLLKIDFLWYLKKISWLAIIGYLAGVMTYYLIHM